MEKKQRRILSERLSLQKVLHCGLKGCEGILEANFDVLDKEGKRQLVSDI
jgi:hypothetical protein